MSAAGSLMSMGKEHRAHANISRGSESDSELEFHFGNSLLLGRVDTSGNASFDF